MLKFISYTYLAVFAVNLLATSGDITITWTSPVFVKLQSNDSATNPLGRPATDGEQSLIASLIYIGGILGPFPFCWLAERFGRKPALLAVALPHLAAYLALAFARSLPLFYAARFIGGLALGAGYALLPMYVAEVAQDGNRGTLSATINVFWCVGNLLPYVVGPYAPMLWFNVALACFPAAFIALFALLGPETPYFLLRHGRGEAAAGSLALLRGGTALSVQKELKHIEQVLASDEHSHFLDLFRTRSHLKALGISLALIVAQQTSGINAVLGYTHQIFQATGADDISDDLASIIIGLVLLASSVSLPFFAERAGRRALLLVSLLGAFLSHVALGAFFFLQRLDEAYVARVGFVPIVALVSYIVFFNVGIGPVPWTVSSELFPANVKSMAASLVAATCWGTSFLVTLFYTRLTKGIGTGETFWLYGGTCFCAMVFTYFCVPETRGRSFSEIQTILGKKE